MDKKDCQWWSYAHTIAADAQRLKQTCNPHALLMLQCLAPCKLLSMPQRRDRTPHSVPCRMCQSRA